MRSANWIGRPRSNRTIRCCERFARWLCFTADKSRQRRNLLREVLAQNPNLHGVRPFLAMCLSAQGQHEAARAELNEDVRRTASVDPDIAYAVASVYALEGARDEAFEWLKRSVALGNENQSAVRTRSESGRVA